MGGRRGIDNEATPLVLFGSPISNDSDMIKPHKESFTRTTNLPNGHWHEVASYDQGFVFFNLQKWPSREMMSSAVVEYGGEPLGPTHEQIIKK